MKKLILTFIALQVTCCLAIAQSPLIQRAKIHCNPQQYYKLATLGIPVEEGYWDKDGNFCSDFYEKDIENIQNAGLEVDILIDDLGKYYKERNIESMKVTKSREYLNKVAAASSWTVPSGFELGSQGGFYTLDEMLTELNFMRNMYPGLITAKSPATPQYTVEGRPVYWVKISDNCDVDEDEPEVLYTGMHHAREPIAMQQMIYYMYYLLENYQTDSLVHYIVDNTELYFIPVVNPDGYVYNQVTNPWGGGNWRKNRKDYGNGNYGVDLNRNYGYMWGIDDIGSSPVPSEETFRGSSGFSEIETQNIRDFVLAHDFQIVLNYHSFRNGVLFPWGYTNAELTPDDSIFRKMVKALTSENHYSFGNVSAVLNYLANGGSDDWFYGEQSVKPKIFAFTPEIGLSTDGFWPIPERIIPLCQDNMWQNFVAALLVNRYATVKDLSSVFLPYQAYLPFSIQRLGMKPSSFTVSIQPLDNSFQNIGPAVTFNNMNYLETRKDSIPYTLSSDVLTGSAIKFLLTVSFDGISLSDTLTKYAGFPTVIYNHDGTSLTGWAGNWAITDLDYHSPVSCITDSPGGPYNNLVNSSITMTSPVSLGNAPLVYLTYWAKWDLEEGYDYVQVFGSYNNGTTWSPLSGKYTHAGIMSEPSGQPVYSGNQSEWVQEIINLQDYIGSNIKIRFTIDTDGGLTRDGFYFDDIQIVSLSPTNIPESNLMDDKISLFPNPSNNRIVIRIPGYNPGNDLIVRIYDELGQEVFNRKPESEFTDIPVLSWNPGLYYFSAEKNGVRIQGGKLIILP